MENYKTPLQEQLKSCFDRMPVLNDLCNRTFSFEELRPLTLNHYAEIRTFIDIKLPARLFLCPHNAISAKKYFCHLYIDEQGGFGEDLNHAELFKPFCHEIGLTDDELHDYFEKYSKDWLILFQKQPSIESLVEELAVSCSWESVTPYFGEQLMKNFRSDYNFSEEAIRYFSLHFTVDDDHSLHAIETLSEYCTDDNLFEIAKKAMETTLVDDLYMLRSYA